MPFTAEQLSYAGKAAMDFEIKQKPEDLYNIDRPLLKALRSSQKEFPGASQFVIEKLRTTNDSNFGWFGPDGEVSFNRKRTLDQASFGWGSAHDGFALTEEELLQNYISVTDDKNAAPTTSERHQFVNLIQENTETLKLGFAEKFDYDLHLDGTQSPDAIPGLDLLVSTTPTTGTVGGINRATQPLWRNYAKTGIASTAGVLSAELEIAHRSCKLRGGMAPNLYLAGSKFIDAYRAELRATQQIHIQAGSNGVGGMDASIDNLSFKGVPIVWDPVLDELQAATNAAVAWDKRLYMLNTKTIRLRPAKGQDMVTRNPPRVYNRFTHYWGVTWRGAMTIVRPSANAIISIA